MKPKTNHYLRAQGLALLSVLALGVYAAVLFRTAWLSDSAYVLYRTLDNFDTGHGLTWNVKDRVQAFVSPLWLLVNWVFLKQSGNIYTGGLSASLVVSLLAVGLGSARLAATPFTAIWPALLCVCSRAFVDFSSSGLENPLSHLILVLFFLIYFRAQRTAKTIFLLAIVMSLGLLTRLDLGLILLPPLLYVWAAERSWRTTGLMAAGLLPWLGWEVFSVIYYGFPLPNPAYARIHAGVPLLELVSQGALYLADSLEADVFTLALIALVLAWIGRRHTAPFTAVGLGLMLYLGYVVIIGGDFMSGRLLSVPFFAALLLLSRHAIRQHKALWGVVLAAAVFSVARVESPPFATGADYGTRAEEQRHAHGISDERGLYFQRAGLLSASDAADMPRHDYAKQGRAWRKANKEMVLSYGNVGYRGYFGGPQVHLIDYYALGDPLLARLPSRYDPEEHIGHFTRQVPEGYVESLQSGENQLKDAGLQAYYEALRRITRGPLWAPERWRAIIAMNFGGYDSLIDAHAGRFPNLMQVDAKQQSAPQAAGAAWDSPGTLILRPPLRGFEIALGSAEHAGQVEISLDWNDPYHVVFLRGEHILGHLDLAPGSGVKRGLNIYQEHVPVRAIRYGYDRIILLLQGKDKVSSLGHLKLVY